MFSANTHNATEYQPGARSVRRLGVLLVAATVCLPAECPSSDWETYRSPYAVRFTWPLSDLVGDLQFSARGDPRIESEVEHRFWYSRHVRQEFGVWGPHPRTY